MVACMDADVLSRNNVTLGGQADGQPMVFAHGYGCDQNMWRFVVPAFKCRYRTVLFDSRAGGADLSANDPRGAAACTAMRRGINMVLALDLHNVMFVGHTVSAMIGVLATARGPDRFAALILVGHRAVHRRRRMRRGLEDRYRGPARLARP